MTNKDIIYDLTECVKNQEIDPKYAAEVFFTLEAGDPSVIVAICNTSRGKLKTRIDAANKAYKAKDYDTAITELEQAKGELTKEKTQIAAMGKTKHMDTALKNMGKIAASILADKALNKLVNVGVDTGLKKAGYQKTPPKVPTIYTVTASTTYHIGKDIKKNITSKDRDAEKWFRNVKKQCLDQLNSDIKRVEHMIKVCQSKKEKLIKKMEKSTDAPVN